MAHTHILFGIGWVVADDGGKKPVLRVEPEWPLTQADAEAAARLLSLALDLPGGLPAALDLLRAIMKGVL